MDGFDGKLNLSMLCDYYEFTMSNGFLQSGVGDKIAYFDLFFRKVPDDGGFAIAAGLSQAIDYIEKLRFEPDDIEYLRSKKIFSEEFLKYLANFNFTCDVWAVPEGTPVFPNEPILMVRGPVMQAQLLETMLLLTINHQSLIATKANRIVRAAEGRAVLEFGARRAHGVDSAVMGARAAYIGGCAGTSCVATDKHFNIPAVGTMAHSWVQLFDSEEEAFRAYAKVYPENAVLLVDTYNVLQSGIKNAIKVFNEEVIPRGFRPAGIRLDSGDIAYLSKKCRAVLDEAGFPDCKIIASNSLDEYIIRDTIRQGAQIDTFAVGERLITSKSEPVFGGVYKLVAVEDENGKIIPKIKISENVTKITTPHFKNLWRFYSKESGQALADVITLHNEVIRRQVPYEIFHPDYMWKRKTLTNFTVKQLPIKMFDKGKAVYEIPTAAQSREYCLNEVSKLWEEVRRFENPHTYYVDLSEQLWNIKKQMLSEGGQG